MSVWTKEAPNFAGEMISRTAVSFPDLTPVAELVDPDVLKAGSVRARLVHDFSVAADNYMNSSVEDGSPSNNGS